MSWDLSCRELTDQLAGIGVLRGFGGKWRWTKLLCEKRAICIMPFLGFFEVLRVGTEVFMLWICRWQTSLDVLYKESADQLGEITKSRVFRGQKS